MVSVSNKEERGKETSKSFLDLCFSKFCKRKLIRKRLRSLCLSFAGSLLMKTVFFLSPLIRVSGSTSPSTDPFSKRCWPALLLLSHVLRMPCSSPMLTSYPPPRFPIFFGDAIPWEPLPGLVCTCNTVHDKSLLGLSPFQSDLNRSLNHSRISVSSVRNTSGLECSKGSSYALLEMGTAVLLFLFLTVDLLLSSPGSNHFPFYSHSASPSNKV